LPSTLAGAGAEIAFTYQGEAQAKRLKAARRFDRRHASFCLAMSKG
jgi:enoyl-[acyl-carrier-protein] reductase (NADH)